MLQQVESLTSPWPPAMPPSAPERTCADWTSLPEIDVQEIWSSAGSSRQGHDYMHARFYSPQMARFFQVDPVLQVKRAQSNPQLWNRYAYVVNNPLKHTDPTGRLLQLIGDEAERRRTLEALRNSVPRHLQKFVQVVTNKKGQVTVDARALNMMKSAPSGNFQALRRIANSPGLVQASTSATSFTTRSGDTHPLSGEQQSFGVTLDSRSGSSQAGVTMVLVASDLGARDTAVTLAHELRHADRFLRGLSFLHEVMTRETSPGNFLVTHDPNGPVNMVTDAAEREALANYDPFFQPQ